MLENMKMGLINLGLELASSFSERPMVVAIRLSWLLEQWLRILPQHYSKDNRPS
jgi:hypothetical protein